MAIIVAIAMIAMVAIALLALATRLASEAKMTRHVAQDAQLRQLLLAGAAAAVDKLNRPAAPARGQPLTLQTPAAGGGDATLLVLHFEPLDADGSQRVLVDASTDKRRLRQLLRLELRQATWKLVEADPHK
jgi:hypothetical protein